MSEKMILLNEKVENLERCIERIKELLENPENRKDLEALVEEIEYYVKEVEKI